MAIPYLDRLFETLEVVGTLDAFDDVDTATLSCSPYAVAR